ncbi:DUF4349 domain-containing protein [Cohnella yongneupensis]|uniref:DUF4349 domain-containing protein n=1 Tax=Cohnella yongneupensis TaxID=425006 RepID=A0ABW0R8K3_9BACL
MEWFGSRKLRFVLTIVVAIGLMMGLAACSSSNNSDNDSAAAAGEAMPQQNAAVAFSEAKDVSNAPVDQMAVPSSAPEEPAAQENGDGSPPTVGGGIGPIADSDSGYGRKVIYQATLVMKVEKFETAEEQLMNLIHMTTGAYTLQFSDSRNPDETGANYVIKVPSQGFTSFLDGLKQIKTVHKERNVAGNDVTEEYVDLGARLKAKQTVEARLLSFMDKATRTDDLVQFSNELARVQEEIEQIKGRIRYLDQNVAFSTVSIRLYQSSGTAAYAEPEEEAKPKDFGDRVYDALSGSAKVLRQFGEGILVVLAALLPILIVASVIGIPAFFILRRRNAERKARAEDRRKQLNAHNLTLANNNDATDGESERIRPSVDTSTDTNLDDRTDR